MTGFARRQPVQRGVVLVTSLVILLVLTLLGLAAIQNTSLEERMAGNLRAENVALQAAEAALRQGEAWLFEQIAVPVPLPKGDRIAGTSVWPRNGPEDLNDSDATLWWEDWTPDQWADPAYATAFDSDLKFTENDSVPDPHYVIEERGLAKESIVVGQQGDLAGSMFYQITARGVDAGGRGESLVRSTYGRRF